MARKTKKVKRVTYRDRKTGRFVKRATWERQKGNRYVRQRLVLPRRRRRSIMESVPPRIPEHLKPEEHVEEPKEEFEDIELIGGFDSPGRKRK